MSEYKLFCPKHYEEIENYELALKDNFEGWTCHHRNGEDFSKEWLIKNNMYYNRTDPHEFRFVPLTTELSIKYNIPTHSMIHKNFKGHKHTEESKTKISNKNKGNTKIWNNKSDIDKLKTLETLKFNASYAGKLGGHPVNSKFGIAFKEHYGFTKTGHESLYASEKQFFNRHGFYRWEDR